jgi:nucleotide-binding universal stress UspA family protein
VIDTRRAPIGEEPAMIKDIVVNLSVGEKPGPAGDYAISIAAAFEAHLAAIAFIYDPILPVSGAGYVPADVIDSQERESVAAAKAALVRFGNAADRAGISAERLTLGTSFGGVGEQFGRIARRFDLSVVGQAEPDKGTIEDIIIESALFESGRPVIVVPYIQREPLKLDRVMACWDGSRSAARAIADAMPLLERAGRVEVVIVSNERGKQDEIEGADMGAHLARHGLNVEVKRTVLGDIDVADVILSHAADAGSDFIVMGGYGHSRFREFVLGGVTRTILQSMTAPVLMAH